MSETIRTRMVEQQERHPLRTILSHVYGSESTRICGCGKPWPCPDRLAADATLRDLDNARIVYRCRPGCAGCDLRDEPWRSNDVKCAVIPDPLPQAAPATDTNDA